MRGQARQLARGGCPRGPLARPARPAPPPPPPAAPRQRERRPAPGPAGWPAAHIANRSRSRSDARRRDPSPLDEQAYAALKEDIAERRILVAVEVDGETGERADRPCLAKRGDLGRASGPAREARRRLRHNHDPLCPEQTPRQRDAQHLDAQARLERFGRGEAAVCRRDLRAGIDKDGVVAADRFASSITVHRASSVPPAPSSGKCAITWTGATPPRLNSPNGSCSRCSVWPTAMDAGGTRPHPKSMRTIPPSAIRTVVPKARPPGG